MISKFFLEFKMGVCCVVQINKFLNAAIAEKNYTRVLHRFVWLGSKIFASLAFWHECVILLSDTLQLLRKGNRGAIFTKKILQILGNGLD